MTPGRLKIWNEDAGEWQYTPGGSEPVKDLGVVTANEVATGGPKLLYTPAAGEIMFGFFLYDITLDNGDGVPTAIGTMADLVADTGQFGDGILSRFDNDLCSADYLPVGSPNPTPPGATNPPRVLVTDPIYAAYYGASTLALIDAAPGTWQAGHLYATGAWIIDSAGHLQQATTGGTTGGSEPSWPASVGTTTSDGGVTWTDEGVVPTVGSGHFAIFAAVPA